MTQIVPFMVALNKMDRQRTTPRDVLVIFAIKNKPGMNGVELTTALNLPFRSSIQNHIRRLQERGYIEDRRVVEHDLTPSAFHITRAGEVLLSELVPA